MLLNKTSITAAFLLLMSGLALAADAAPASAQKSAVLVAAPMHAPMLAAVRAGKRLIAAGDHGVILLSDNEGKTWRQAQAVPTQALLSSLSFVDDKLGWACGHDGVILHTSDGGDTWTLQREFLDGDKPLFAIHFRDAQHGFAVGLFGTAVQTADGGKTWKPLAVEAGPAADHHLYAIFGDPAGALIIASEAGLLYRSVDTGANWTPIQTSNPGSFWTGLQLKDGSMLAAGQRGHLFSSHDQGLSWTEVASDTQLSITSIVQLGDKQLLIVGLAGAMLESNNGGETFTLHERADRAALTAALAISDGALLLFGDSGVVARVTAAK